MANQISNRLEVSRFVAPSDFIFKVQSFSSLLSSTAKPVQSETFESGGYNWKLCLSSKGSKKEDGPDHISLYLSLADTSKLPSGWEILVNCKFFLSNQIKNEFLSIQDGEVWRFNCLKTEWGMEKLLAMSSFTDPTNGYLVDDCCAFGAEIYIIKPNKATFGYVDLSKPHQTWKITDYKSKTKTILYSPEFIIGGWKWKLKLFPNGQGKSIGSCVSVFLCFYDSESLGNSKLETRYKLRIKDQVSGGSQEAIATTTFGSSNLGWGFHNFLSLKDVKDVKNGYLLNNTMVVEVEICSLSKLPEIKISDAPKGSAKVVEVDKSTLSKVKETKISDVPKDSTKGKSKVVATNTGECLPRKFLKKIQRMIWLTLNGGGT